jgi:hypothetical protein
LGGPGCTLYVCMCVGVCGVGWAWSQAKSVQVKSGQIKSGQVGWAAAAGFGAGRGRKKKHTQKQKQKQSKDENPDVDGARARADATVTPCACRLSSRFVSSRSLFLSPPCSPRSPPRAGFRGSLVGSLRVSFWIPSPLGRSCLFYLILLYFTLLYFTSLELRNLPSSWTEDEGSSGDRDFFFSCLHGHACTRLTYGSNPSS